MHPIRNEKDLDTLRRSVSAYGAICAWTGHNLFEKLADREPRSASELGVHPRSLEITGMALMHLGLVNREGDRWSLSANGASLYQEGVLDTPGAEKLFTSYAQLDTIMETGRAAETTEGGVVETDVERARTFMNMLYRRSAQSVEEVARRIKPWLHDGDHILDVGGGHGRYGEALRERCGANITLFDRAVCVEIAKERFGDSQSYIAGDFMTDSLGGPYDGALLSNIVHGFSLEENRTLVRRLAACMKPGALLVFKDMFFGETGAQLEEAAMFGMTMLLFTREGRSFSAQEMTALAAEEGFEKVGVLPVPDCNFSLIVARRSA